MVNAAFSLTIEEMKEVEEESGEGSSAFPLCHLWQPWLPSPRPRSKMSLSLTLFFPEDANAPKSNGTLPLKERLSNLFD